MLNKKQRLERASFDRCFLNGKKQHSPHLTLVYMPEDVFKAAVVVGKKVYKRAVDRNRLRRQLYAELAEQQKQSPRTGFYIVMVKPAAKNTSVAVLKEELWRLLNC